jgi:uncharacterized membrane protein
MNGSALNDTLVLGALTGMRSMAGAAALARRYDGALRNVMPVLALGEMVADKTSVVGNRIDPVPLAGRALIGAVVGGVIARERDQSVVVHGLLGAATAIVAAHLAYRVRTRLPLPSLAGGLIEDSIVVSVASLYASPAGRDDIA